MASIEHVMSNFEETLQSCPKKFCAIPSNQNKRNSLLRKKKGVEGWMQVNLNTK